METNSSDLITIAISAYKDKVEAEIIEKFKKEYSELLSAEVEARRQKTHALITQMAKLDIALTQFEFTYNQIKDSIGSIEAVETYIRDIKFQIKKISYEKNSRK